MLENEHRNCILVLNSPDRKDDDITYVNEIMYGLQHDIYCVYSFCEYDNVAIVMGNRYGCNIISTIHTFEHATIIMNSVYMNYCIVMPSKGRDDSVTEDIIRRYPIKDNLFVR